MSTSATESTESEPTEPAAAPTGSFQPLHTVDELLAAARRQGLALTTEAAELDGMGLDFLVVHARDADGTVWIVRTPRRAAVVAAARVEARVLRLVGPRLPVAVPDWRVHADDVIGYPRLAGIPAVTIDPERGPQWNLIDPAAPSDRFLDSFAVALVALQAIPATAAVDAGVPVRSIAEARASIADAMRETRALLEPSEAVWAHWQRWLDDDAGWPEHLAMVHGDLHPGHTLLGDDGAVTGVLDWTEAQLTDPSVDFAMFHRCFQRPALEDLVARFERLGGRTWPGLVEHAIGRDDVASALAAQWVLRTGNDTIMPHVRAGLDTLTSRLAGSAA